MPEFTALRWTLTIGLIAVFFLLDLLLDRVLTALHLEPTSFRVAAVSSLLHVAAAVAFGAVLVVQAGADAGVQFLAAYQVEKTLSLDNLFVLVLVMAGYAVAARESHLVLTVGIVLAIGLRAIFVTVGAVALSAFSPLLLVYGLALVVAAFHLARHGAVVPDVQRSRLVRLARRVVPVADQDRSGRLLVRQGDRPAATPLLLLLLMVAGTDLLFALESVPAVFAVTDQPYLVFSATAFALLGLRSLFFVAQSALARLTHLPVALAVVLAFVGVKLVLDWAHGQNPDIPEISNGASLATVTLVLVLASTAVVELVRVRRERG